MPITVKCAQQQPLRYLVKVKKYDSTFQEKVMTKLNVQLIIKVLKMLLAQRQPERRWKIKFMPSILEEKPEHFFQETINY